MIKNYYLELNKKFANYLDENASFEGLEKKYLHNYFEISIPENISNDEIISMRIECFRLYKSKIDKGDTQTISPGILLHINRKNIKDVEINSKFSGPKEEWTYANFIINLDEKKFFYRLIFSKEIYPEMFLDIKPEKEPFFNYISFQDGKFLINRCSNPLSLEGNQKEEDFLANKTEIEIGNSKLSIHFLSINLDKDKICVMCPFGFFELNKLETKFVIYLNKETNKIFYKNVKNHLVLWNLAQKINIKNISAEFVEIKKY